MPSSSLVSFTCKKKCQTYDHEVQWNRLIDGWTHASSTLSTFHTWQPRRELADFSSIQCSDSSSSSLSVVGCVLATLSIHGAGILTWQKWHCGPVGVGGEGKGAGVN